jgi:hypothetical protein
MPWYTYIAHFFAGAFLCNAIPHFAHGVSGEKFQSPFAKPPGIGLSPPITNVLWGFANAVVGTGLVLFWPPRALPSLGVMALGILAMGLMLANHFGKVKGNSK